MRCAHIVTINILSCYIYHSIYRDTYLHSKKRLLMVYKIYGTMLSLMGRSTTWWFNQMEMWLFYLLKILCLVQPLTPSVDSELSHSSQLNKILKSILEMNFSNKFFKNKVYHHSICVYNMINSYITVICITVGNTAL